MLTGTPNAAGLISDTIFLSTSGEGLSGESPVPVQVSYSGQVFSGNAQWSGTSSNGSWAANANWSDCLGDGVQAAPGVWGVSGDSATLCTAGTITLNGASPSLALLAFSSSSAGCGLATGSGGTLHMYSSSGMASLTAAGCSTISAAVALDSSLNVAVANPCDALNISGPIGGSGGLVKPAAEHSSLPAIRPTPAARRSMPAVQVGTSAALGPGTTALAVNAGTLAVNGGALVDVATTISNNGGTVVLNGGTIRAQSFAGLPMAFNAGTLEYTSSLSVAAADWLEGTLGPGRPIGPAQQLIVDGATTLNDVLTLSGGTLSTGSLVNPAWLQFQSGTFNLTGDNLSISTSGLFGSGLTLPSGDAVNVTNKACIAAGASLTVQGGEFSAALLTNSGTIGGFGQINAPLINAPGGLVLALTGDHPVFTGGGNVNQGQIQLAGGTLEFTGALANCPGGLIAGSGNLIVSGGLLNSGSMAILACTNISGPVTNGPGGLVNTTGGATTFLGNVVNNGTIYTENGSSTVFDGAVSGSGAFTGPGTASFEGALSPGDGPAALFVNQAYLAGLATQYRVGRHKRRHAVRPA